MENGKNPRVAELLASYGADPARWPGETPKVSPDDAAVREAREIDLVLGLASTPVVPAGAADRLLARIRVPEAEIVPFRPKRKAPRSFLPYAAALPLAASLALGIYLGAAGRMDVVLPATLTDTASISDESFDDLGGIGDADAYAEESSTS